MNNALVNVIWSTLYVSFYYYSISHNWHYSHPLGSADREGNCTFRRWRQASIKSHLPLSFPCSIKKRSAMIYFSLSVQNLAVYGRKVLSFRKETRTWYVSYIFWTIHFIIMLQNPGIGFFQCVGPWKEETRIDFHILLNAIIVK